MPAAVLVVEGEVRRLDGDPAGVGDRVARVDAQVGQDLVQLRRIDLHLAQIGGRGPHQIDVLADQAFQHAERAGHGLVQVQHDRHGGLVPGERQKLARQIGRAQGRGADALQLFGQGRGRLGDVQRQLRAADDHPEHVVEVVRDAAGQSADGLQALRGLQLRGQRILLLHRLHARRDVLGENDDAPDGTVGLAPRLQGPARVLPLAVGALEAVFQLAQRLARQAPPVRLPPALRNLREHVVVRPADQVHIA